MAKFVNLTPHSIKIRKEDGTEIVVEPSGIVARVAVKQELIGSIDEIPIVANLYGDPEGLPETTEADTYYIVSSLVKSHPKLRDNELFVAPDTGPTAIRDSSNKIVAVTRLVAKM